MHRKIIQKMEENIGVSNGVVAYFYDVTPTNSHFVDEGQVSALVELFQRKMIRLNMPGQIVIRPVSIQATELVKYYNNVYKAQGLTPFRTIAQGILKDIADLNRFLRYRYQISFIFVEGRENFEVTSLRSFSFLKKNVEMAKDTFEFAQIVNEQILNELNNGCEARKMTSEEVNGLISYLACPVEQPVESFFYTPGAQLMEYEYKLLHNVDDGEMAKVVTRNIMISNLPSKMNETSNIFNRLQLMDFPVDIVLKFDILANRDFVKKMQRKEVDIEKSIKAESKNRGYTSRETKKAAHLRTVGIQGENADEKAKVKYQIMLRVYAKTQEMLLKRYNKLQLYLGADVEREDGIQIAYEIGYQEEIANNMNPFDVTYSKHVHTTDISFLAKFNWLGGLYIGEPDVGMIIGYTRPGKIPVRINPFAPIEGKSRRTAPVSIFMGESGSGKSQLMNNLMLEYIAIYGLKFIAIDPKGDRYKLFDKMPPGMAQNIVLGGESDQRGILDPFVNYEPDKAIKKAQTLLMQFARAINPQHQINLRYIDQAIEDCQKEVDEGMIKKITLTEVSKKLHKYDPLWSDNMLSLTSGELSYLFFAQHDKPVKNFNLTYSLNLVTFAGVPDIKKFDPHNKEHQIFSILIAEIETFIHKFMRMNENEVTGIMLDEVQVWLNTTDGSNAIDNLTRLGRSFQTLIMLADQRGATFKGIRDQASQVFIGSIASGEEVEDIIEYYGLDNNEAIRSLLEDKTKVEGFEKDQQYRFLYIDYNNRKAVLRAELHSEFADAFDTKKKEITYESHS